MQQRYDTTWDERALLLLGVLLIQRQHGYQINDFIERCGITDMKKPTAYALLDRLAVAGMITVEAEQAGNRPVRKVYTITATGRELFQDLLEKTVATADRPIANGDIGLMFLNHLAPDRALDHLEQRLDAIEHQLTERAHADLPPDHGHLGIDLVLGHQRARLEADRAWLSATIARLKATLPVAATSPAS